METENTPVKHYSAPVGCYTCSERRPSRSFNLAGPKCTESNTLMKKLSDLTGTQTECFNFDGIKLILLHAELVVLK